MVAYIAGVFRAPEVSVPPTRPPLPRAAFWDTAKFVYASGLAPPPAPPLLILIVKNIRTGAGDNESRQTPLPKVPDWRSVRVIPKPEIRILSTSSGLKKKNEGAANSRRLNPDESLGRAAYSASRGPGKRPKSKILGRRICCAAVNNALSTPPVNAQCSFG